MAKLKAKKRNALPSSEFALPGKRKDPIPDRSHAKAALTMGMRGASPAEKSEIRAAVHKKFPGVGEGGRMKKDEKKGEAKKPGKRSGGGGKMTKHMGERGDHDATGAHEGRCLMGDCK